MPLAIPTRKRSAAELEEAPSLGERAAAAARASAARVPRIALATGGGGATQGASASSARTLLEQALRSGDGAMLEEVRGTHSADPSKAAKQRLRLAQS
jgi:hypothetical protein